jgi:hypothetical protein
MSIRQRFFVCHVALAVLALGSWGCGNPATQPSQAPDPPVGPNAPDAQAPTDESFTPEEYIRLGLPAHDRSWSGDDMVRAQKVLAALAQKGYRHLPRYKSERSGEVFARLTSPQNLDLLRDRSLPLDARMPQAGNYLQASNQLYKLYLSAFLKNDVRDSELVEWLGAMLRATAVMFEMADEFLPTLKKDDPTYPVRMGGLERMKRGLATLVAAGFQTLTERQGYRDSELARLVGYMQETFPLIVPRLPPGARAETMMRLEEMQEAPALKDLRPGLRELHLKVKGALAKGKAP